MSSHIFVTLRGLTLTGADFANAGGAIYNLEQLTVEDCIVIGNAAQWGGGIYNGVEATVNLNRSTVSGNSAISPLPEAIGSGGGLYNEGGFISLLNSVVTGNDSVSDGGGIRNAGFGTLYLEFSKVSDNNSATTGGGIRSDSGYVYVIRSSISSNHANGSEVAGSGGGIYNNFGTLEIRQSTIDGNTGTYGGGVYLGGSLSNSTTIDSSTISGNTATLGGGGIYNFQSSLNINYSTITENIAPAGLGSGLASWSDPLTASTTVRSTIIAGNEGSDVYVDVIEFTSIVSAGYNLIGLGDGIEVFNATGDQTGVTNPLLGPLADNGGPTQTHALLSGSPAIDAGDPGLASGEGVPLYDQRGEGFDRIRDGDANEDVVMDIGAFEVQQFAIVPDLLGDYNRDNSVDAADYTIWRNTLGQDVDQPYDGADGDGDGKVDADDRRVWKMHFGESIEIGGGGAGAIELAGIASLDGMILVTTLDDTINFSDGVTSLREAVFAANTVSGPNTIEFDPALTAEQPGTILLTLGELAITDALIISGPGADRLSVDASGNDADSDTLGNGTRVVNIDDQTSNVTFSVEIRDLRLTGGDVAESGGAILSHENFTGVRLVVEGNHSFQGGAISLVVRGGTSSIIDSELRDNSATGGGGAVELFLFNSGSGVLTGNTIRSNEAKLGGAIVVTQADVNSTLTIDGSSLLENAAQQQGGAIALLTLAPKTTIRNSTISSNTAGSQGGGLFISSRREVSVVNSTISQNRTLGTQSVSRGGGIYAQNADLSITASTITGNDAQNGGGIHSRFGELAINFSTLAENDASSGSGGGLYSLNDRLTLLGSTITGNTAGGTTTNQGRGGGIWHTPSFNGPSTVADNVISNNQASLEGGGLYFRPIAETVNGVFLTLQNVTVTGNTAQRGGGISTSQVSSGSSNLGMLVLNGGSVSGNTALAHGGGIYSRIGNLTINDTTINGNRARSNGGGIAGAQTGGTIVQATLNRAAVQQNIAGATIDGQLSSGDGGGLWFTNSTSSVSINESQVTGNVARRGAGIFRLASGPQGLLVLNGSTVSGNVAENQGGGLYNQGGMVSIMNSTIAGNVASVRTSTGGGIFNRNGDLLISYSTISGNMAPEGRGGGIYHGNGDLAVKLSTISGNYARQEGGGVWAIANPNNDRIEFHSTTVSGNSALVQTGAMVLRGPVAIRHSTISANFAQGTSAAPAGVSFPDGGLAEIDHSIIAGNMIMSGQTPDLVANNLPIANVRNSIIGSNFGLPLLPEAPLGSPDSNGNLIGRPVEFGGSGLIDPQLAPLADNGGPTQTHAILPGSPALDGGTVVTTPPLGFDQRGNPFSRMVDGTGDGVVRIDIGAYESQGVPSFSPGDFNRNGFVDAGDYTLWRQTKDHYVEPFTDCDASGDGCIGLEDYAIWKSHFGDGIQLNAGGGSAAVFAMMAEEPLVVAEQPNSLFMLTESSSARTSVAKYSSRGVATADLPNDALVAWLADRSRMRLSADEAAEALESTGEETASDAISTAFDAVFMLLGE